MREPWVHPSGLVRIALPYQSLAAALRTHWRAALRELAAVPDDSPRADRIRAEIDTLRLEYQRLATEARQYGALDLPPLPGSSEPPSS